MNIFEKEFKLDNSGVTELFSLSSFLLQDTVNIISEVRHILVPSKELFTQEQAESTMELIKHVSLLDGAISDIQAMLIGSVTKELLNSDISKGKWS